MNFKKLMQIVNYVLSKHDYRLNYTKLIKLLYIVDRTSLERWNFAISNDDYCSMKNGPVLSSLYKFIKNKGVNELQTQWNKYFQKDGYDLLVIEKGIDKDEMSEAELEIIDDIVDKYRGKTYSQMIEIGHNFPEWDDRAQKFNTSIPIEKTVILKEIGRSAQEIDNIIRVENACKKGARRLLGGCNA